MRRRTILAIVEGHGEVTALPELLHRIAGEISPDIIVETPRPIRVPRNKLVKQGELERAVAFASHKAGTDGCIIVLLDADRDCPAELAPQLLARAVAASPGRDIRAVLAKAEYEAWFLAAAGSLAGRRGLDQALASPDDFRSHPGRQGLAQRKDAIRPALPGNTRPGCTHCDLRYGRSAA